eukprot:475885-Amorphochlora_amoeboformis.AAC.1
MRNFNGLGFHSESSALSVDKFGIQVISRNPVHYPWIVRNSRHLSEARVDSGGVGTRTQTRWLDFRYSEVRRVRKAFFIFRVTLATARTGYGGRILVR